MPGNRPESFPTLWRWSTRRDGPRLAAGLLISGAFTWLAVREVDWVRVWGIIAQARWGWLIGALGSTLLATWCRAVRWRILLQPQRPVHTARLLGAVWVGQALNALIPVRLGEVARGLMIAQETSSGNVPALWSLALEKLLDVLTVLLFLAGLAFIVPLPIWVRSAGLTLALASLGAILSLLGITKWRSLLNACLDRSTRRHPWIARLGLRRLLEVITESTNLLHSARLVAALTTWSVFCFVSAALPNAFVARSLDVPLPFTGSFLLLAILQISAVPPLPTSLGRIGIFHYLCLITLEIYGLSTDAALGYALILHTVTYLPIFIGGIWGMWQRWHHAAT